MDKESLMQAHGLNDQQAEGVLKLLAGKVDKAVLEEAQSEAERLKADLAARDKQLKEIGKSAEASQALQEQIKALQEQNKKQQEEHAAEMRRERRSRVDDELLTELKARDKKSVAAHLDAVSDDVDDEAYRAMRRAALESLKADGQTGFLFGSEAAQFKGASPVGQKTVPPDSAAAGFAARIEEARKSGQLDAVIAAKREAHEAGIHLP